VEFSADGGLRLEPMMPDYSFAINHGTGCVIEADRDGRKK
jgi:hypothetical protein